MKTRIITAVIGLLIFVPVLLKGGTWLLSLALLMGLVGMSEILRMKHRFFVSMEAILSFIGVLALIMPANFWQGMPVHSAHIVYYLIAFLLLTHTVLKRNQFNFDDAGVLTLAVLYVGAGYHYFFQARQAGLEVLMFGMLLVWLTDSCAYFVGKQFGRHKLAPKISPNKTWEGSVGGSVIAVAVVTALYVVCRWLPQYSLLETIFFATILSVGGQIGDLIESGFKRHYGVKDSGTLLPGHGGILDRFDSMLVVMPLMAAMGMLG